MFCPNLSDPKIKEQFEKLQSVAPDLAHYLWDKYEGEVPAKYYNLSNLNVMESRVPIDELLNRYMRQEVTYDFVNSIRNNPEFIALDSYEKRLGYIGSQVKQQVDEYTDKLNSVTKVGNRYYVHTSNKVKQTKQVYFVAESIVKGINKKFVGLDKPIAYAYEDQTGIFFLLTNSLAPFEPLYELIDEVEAEEIRAEIEMLDKMEAMRAEKQALLEKQIEANEYITEEGEVLPYNGTLFFRHFELAKQLSKKEIKQYERLFNRLAAKFPGVQWAWDTTIPQAGKIDFNSGLVLINPAFMNPELAFHEFGHILIRSIKQSNPELFESLKAEVEALHAMNPETSAVSYVTDLYPDLIGTEEFWEEVITTELGRQSAFANKPSLFQRILNWFKSIFANEQFVPTENTTLQDLVDVMIGTEQLVDIYELSPETQDYMESRVLDPSTVDAMLQYVRTDENTPDKFQTYQEQLNIITNAIKNVEIKKIFDTNNYLKIGNESLKRSLWYISQIKDLVTEEDIAASVLDLADYLNYSSLYLNGLAAHLNKLLEDPNIPQGKKLGDLHRAHKQAMAFKKHMEKIVELFTPEVVNIAFTESRINSQQINNNHFLKNLFWINQSIKGIESLYDKNLVKPVLGELASSLEIQRAEIEKSFDNQIAALQAKKQTDRVKQQIKDLKERKKKEVPTPENIERMLKDPTSPWYLSFDSSMYTKTPSVQLIAGYIKNVNNEFLRNLQGVATEWQQLMDEVSKVEGAFTGSVIDVKEFYKPYYRETVLLKVVDGELVGQPVLALNTPIKTVEIKNRITELNHLIATAPTEEEAAKHEETLKKFYEDYTERPFTDEYYEIQKLLPDDIRKKRNLIFEEIAALREEFGMGEVNDEVLERLKAKEKELFDMERFYDDLGRRKMGEDLAVAESIQAWKDAKRNAATIQYELTEDAKLTFERSLAQRKEKLKKALAQAKTAQQRDAAQQEYDTWASVYTRTVYTDEFYLERQIIIDQIQDLLAGRGAISDRYQELFNILKGNKDQNGEYLPTSLTAGQVATARNIELEIEAIKGLLKETSPLGKETKKQLASLVEKLQAIQSSVNSRYYEEAVDSIKAELRSEIFQQNPELSDESIEALVHRAFLESDWYQENHISKLRWNEDIRQVVEVEEPIFMWRVTRPTNEKHIEKEAPAFVWYKTKVADEFKNPLYRPGEVTFKQVTGGDYYNSNFDSLRPEQKKILMKMRDLHYKSQEGLYQSDKLGDIIPGLYKTNAEIILDGSIFSTNRIKSWFDRIKSWFVGDREAFEEDETEDLIGNPEQTDAFGDPVVRESRRLFNRYARAIDRDKQSYNLMVAMASYATSSERFRVMRKYQSTILAMEEVLTRQGETGARKNIGQIIDRELYGKYANKSQIGSVLRATTKLAGFKTLGFNLLALPQNWISGMLSIYGQAGFYGIRKRDILKAQADTVGISKDFYMYYNKFGNKPLSLALVDYFVGTQSQTNQASEIDNRGITKYGKVWKTVHTLRDFTEFDIAAITTYAFLNKYKVKLKDSDRSIPLKDAFELKDGVIQIRPDVEVGEDFLALIKNRIQLANERAQGNYADVTQPTASANAFYKMALFLKKWIIPQFKSTWGGETIHYHSGIRTVGSHRAMMNFVKESILDPSNIMNTWKYSPDFQKAGVKQFMFQYSVYIAFANMLMQMSLRLNCEDDGEEDWKDYVCLGLKRTANEAEGVFTLWGLGEFYFTFAKEKANGVDIFEKIGWQLAGPISVYRKFFTDEKLYSDDPYYKYRPNSTKIDWDKTHPMLAGKSGLAVLGLEALGSRGMDIGPKSIEYQNRAFNDFTPKTYTKELRTRYKKDHEGLEVMPTRLPQAQLNKQFKKEVKEIQKKILSYKQKGEAVPEDLTLQLQTLIASYKKVAKDYKEGKVDESRGLFVPIPFFPSREGLDMSPGEISEIEPEEE